MNTIKKVYEIEVGIIPHIHFKYTSEELVNLSNYIDCSIDQNSINILQNKSITEIYFQGTVTYMQAINSIDRVDFHAKFVVDNKDLDEAIDYHMEHIRDEYVRDDLELDSKQCLDIAFEKQSINLAVHKCRLSFI